ncbi:hypothetical protein Lal_00017907 [Lupinus albus]|nr:hypothetical protein Lal_00017907 [Lupinus albus]
MGNLLVNSKRSNHQTSTNGKGRDGRISSTISTTAVASHFLPRLSRPPRLPRPPPPPQAQSFSKKPSFGTNNSAFINKNQHVKKYAFIPDNFTTLEQVTTALRNEGLESSNLILGIDFTKRNEWSGK